MSSLKPTKNLTEQEEDVHRLKLITNDRKGTGKISNWFKLTKGVKVNILALPGTLITMEPMELLSNVTMGATC